ncbi:hypothetical protein [Actinomadura sp. NEAU-AAG7]|uniref:hypothetical protein n=1 Tax=Actinomadura sp. NEAU-AAG7 TaxID=2839640 RepID=UPI001BE419AD|nr:hypothetical protein [Actinomadura sp. NEAU-AAG7]MBT2208891.1 hypothetical protein [Actinomadura sp. NEAU-AAG7]
MASMKTTALALAATTAATCLVTAGVAHAYSTAAPATTTQAVALPPGYQIVTLPNATVPNFQRRTLLCPGTKHVLGGGAEAQGNGAILVGSFPTGDGRGWIALGRQIGYNDVGISVYAICAD